MRDSKRLAAFFGRCPSRAAALFEYAEFLAGKEGAEVAAAPPTEPLASRALSRKTW